MATFLQLPPEMGGIRFGPFQDGSIHLGNDNRRCQIVLDASHGVLPMHCTVAINPNGGLTLSPVSRVAQTFLQKAGNPKVWPVQQAVGINPGDTVILGHQAGPRFLVQQENPAPAPGAGPPRGGRGRGGAAGYAKGMANYAMRRQKAKLIARNPIARQLYQLQHRWKTGALMRPHVILGSVLALVTVVGAAMASCGAGAIAIVQGLLGG